VRSNLAYGLRVRKTAKAEIEHRVGDVAQMLGLEQYLERKPAKLSGGQRQRVAMGRAIVREPQAFLMDEPLSNLDAKLRVGMRAELARLHARLQTTTVYVTHDQVEAMTLGQRVTVMKDGLIQQVGSPLALYRDPANLFVATFMGSPAMNLVSAVIEGGTITFAGITLPLANECRPTRDGSVILGMRPGDFHDHTRAASGFPEIDVEVAMVEELGASTHVLFWIEAPPVETAALSQDDSSNDARLLVDDSRSLFTAALAPGATVPPGKTVRLAIDVRHLHFFDPETGDSLRASSATKAQATAVGA
jgi:multiple sugar transport system ATP-binding protein